MTRTIAACMTVLLASILCGTSQAAIISSSTDVFENAAVVGSTGFSQPNVPGSANMFFGANPEVDKGTMTFFSDVGIGSVASIDFQPGLVNLTGVRLMAGNDGQSLGFRRSMSNFRLLADLDMDSTFETVLVNQAINVDYGLQPGNAGTNRKLDLTFNFGSVIANSFRAEFVQGAQVGRFEGVRLIELDAIGTEVVPEPTSLAIWSAIGGVGLVVGRYRRKRKAL